VVRRVEICHWTAERFPPTMVCMSDHSDNSDHLAQALATMLRAVASESATKPATKKLLRVQDAAEQLSISKAHVYSLIRSGDIRSVKLGNARRVAQSEIDRIMAAGEAS
jgi:excisionase family DNA binding protein